MKTKVGSIVHPWYKGTHEWEVKGIVELKKPIEYNDLDQEKVSYDPKMIELGSEQHGKVLWFTYWMATSKTKGKMKWGQRPPMLEESVFLELLKGAIRQGLLGENFLTGLNKELELALKE